jgi:hypothetical protein
MPVARHFRTTCGGAQAELDHHVRDTYNYVTVQADIAMPGRQLAVLEDTYRQASPLPVAALRRCLFLRLIRTHHSLSLQSGGCMLRYVSSSSTVLQPDYGDSKSS